MPSWPQSSRHHGQGPRPTTGRRYGIGGFRGMNPQPESSRTIGRDHGIPIVNKTRGIHNSNEIIKNSPHSGNRFKKANDNISTMMNNSTSTDAEIQQLIEGKSKAWQYLAKWQHKTNMPKDCFKTEIDHERLRSSDQIARSRGASSPRKHDNVNINKMGINNKKKFLGQHSASHMNLNPRDISYMHERSLSPQQNKRRKFSVRHSSGNQNSPDKMDTNRNLSIYGLASSIENISTSLRNKHSKDASRLRRYSGNINHRSLSPGYPNESYQSVKEFEERKNKLRRSYSPDKEVIPDRDYPRNRDQSPYNETALCSRRQALVQHTSRHIRHGCSPSSDRQQSRYRHHSPEFDISPPRVHSPEPIRSISRQSSPSRELSLSRRWSPSRDHEHTKNVYLARKLAISKIYNNEKDLLHRNDLLKKGRSPPRQTTSFFQEKYEKHNPDHSRMRGRPKEYYDSRACKSDRSLSPTGYRVKSPVTRGRSQERILKHKSHRRLSPHEYVHKRASPPARNISPRRSSVLPRSHDKYSAELSRLSPLSFLQNMNALHKEYSPVLIENHEEDDGYRSREGSRTSSLERFLFPDKRYREENPHKKSARIDHGLEKYEDSRVLEKKAYSHRRPISERLEAVFDRSDREEDINDFPIEVETEEKDLRCELIKIKEKKVEDKIRELEENERETAYKLSVLERKLDRKEHEELSAKIQEKKRNSQFSGSNRMSRINDIQPVLDRKEHEDSSVKIQDKKRSLQFSGSNRLSRIDIQPRSHKFSMKRNAHSDNRFSGKSHSARSTAASPSFQKGEPTNADSVKQSRSLVKKKDSLPLKGTGKHSPIHF